MRPIKFRAWNNFAQKMFSWEDLLTESHLLRSALAGEHFITAEKRYIWEVMQYTGLKDKNGKEIYEGDRVKFNMNFSDSWSRAYWSEKGFTGVVVFYKYGYRIDDVIFEKMYDVDYVMSMQGRPHDEQLLEKYSKIQTAFFEDMYDTKVVGNIYENKP